MASFLWHDPVRLRFGRGIVAGLLAGLPRPLLLVCGRRSLERSGLANRVDPSDGVWAHTGVPPLPGPVEVERLARRAGELDARCLLGLGGGSVLDVTKTAAVLLHNGPDLAALAERLAAGRSPRRAVMLVAVPTTAGTGSEVTPTASLWSEAGEKSSFEHEQAFADRAWIDPELCDGMHATLTASSGLDALAHAMEALWGRRAQPISDLHARAALRCVAEHLAPAVRAAARGEPSPRARDGMSLGALHAGLALSATASAAAHALSYGLTGCHGVAHGLAVGLLCRGLLPLMASLVPERVGWIVQDLGQRDLVGVQRFIDQIFVAAGLSPALGDLGVPRAALPGLAARAGKSGRLANSPGDLGTEQLLGVLESVA